MIVLRCERLADGDVDRAIASIGTATLARTPDGAFVEVEEEQSARAQRLLAFAGVRATAGLQTLAPRPGTRAALGRDLTPLPLAAVALDLVHVRALAVGAETQRLLRARSRSRGCVKRPDVRSRSHRLSPRDRRHSAAANASASGRSRPAPARPRSLHSRPTAPRPVVKRRSSSIWTAGLQPSRSGRASQRPASPTHFSNPVARRSSSRAGRRSPSFRERRRCTRPSTPNASWVSCANVRLDAPRYSISGRAPTLSTPRSFPLSIGFAS